ncbi:unnamed protein product [Cuscuta campestris]|uniref:Uncharacterized protein n=1 Tax=Cuscuta campestris TaxID=132261 RepID=A0A484LA64_9ASTE|nr:unnamed protein product [Cuscuta campestris]
MSRSLSISRSFALWLSESLSHPPLAREGWVISKFEGSATVKSHWDSNQFGCFVRFSAGTDREKSTICIPVGRNSEGIRLFVKGLNEVLKFQEGTVSAEKELLSPWKAETSVPIDFTDQMLQVERVGEEHLSYPSISSSLLQRDVTQGARMTSLSEHELNDGSEETKEAEDEEKKIQMLFQPAFDAYFETIFRAVEKQVQEALARTSLLDKLKMGFFQNMAGKTLRATRETVKSMEKVTLVQFEDTKYTAFISCSKADERIVAEFLTGEQVEESQDNSG